MCGRAHGTAANQGGLKVDAVRDGCGRLNDRGERSRCQWPPRLR